MPESRLLADVTQKVVTTQSGTCNLPHFTLTFCLPPPPSLPSSLGEVGVHSGEVEWEGGGRREGEFGGNRLSTD